MLILILTNMRIIAILIISLAITTEAYISTLMQKPFYKKSNNVVLNTQKKNNYIICNEKYIYKTYLISLRKVKKTIKNGSNNDIIKLINLVTNIVNNSNIKVENVIHEEKIFIAENNSFIDNNKLIAKTLLLSNIKVDVSNVKYIKISTHNDTLVVELDKNDNTYNNNNVVKYDIKNLDAFISALSILMNVFNIH